MMEGVFVLAGSSYIPSKQQINGSQDWQLRVTGPELCLESPTKNRLAPPTSTQTLSFQHVFLFAFDPVALVTGRGIEKKKS